MEIHRTTLDTCADVRGTVVAIDVLRAFTTSAFAFMVGAERILLVESVTSAFVLREEIPDALLMGEVDGLPIPGFDFGNSPAEIGGHDLSGQTLIQRTTAGTRGVVLAEGASLLVAAGLCNAAATARYLEAHAEGEIHLLETGVRADGGGDEDRACGDLIAAYLEQRDLDPGPLVRRVRESGWGRRFDGEDPSFPAADLDLALQIDRFGFAMPVTREEGGLLVMRPERS